MGRRLLPAVLALGGSLASGAAGEAGTLPPCRKSPVLYALQVPEQTDSGVELHEELLAFGGKGWEWQEKGHKHRRNPQLKRKVEMLGDTWLFDLTTRQWREMPTQTSPAPRWKAATTQIFQDHQLALYGGCTETSTKYVQDDLWVYNASTTEEGHWWRRVPTEDGPVKRRGHVLVPNSTHIVVVGGKTAANGPHDKCLTDVWAYPKEALKEGAPPAKWTRGAEFPAVCRWGSTGSLLTAPDGRLLLGIFGGRYLHQDATQHSTSKRAYTYFNELWLYDFAADAWSLAPTEGDAPRPRDHHGATTLDGNLYVFGGRIKETRADDAVRDDVWSYSIADGRWTLHSEGRGPIARYMPGVATVNWQNESLLAVFAGETFPGSTKQSSLNDLWVFSPRTGEWTEMSPSDCENTPTPNFQVLTRATVERDMGHEGLALGAGAILVALIGIVAKLASKTASARTLAEEQWLQVDEDARTGASVEFHRL